MTGHAAAHSGGPELLGTALGLVISVPWLVIIGWRRVVNRYR